MIIHKIFRYCWSPGALSCIDRCFEDKGSNDYHYKILECCRQLHWNLIASQHLQLKPIQGLKIEFAHLYSCNLNQSIGLAVTKRRLWTVYRLWLCKHCLLATGSTGQASWGPGPLIWHKYCTVDIFLLHGNMHYTICYQLGMLILQQWSICVTLFLFSSIYSC